jgi:type II restriction enzyme
VPFTFDDLANMYEEKRKKYGADTYRYVSEILREAKIIHKTYFSQSDHEQSWRAFKGKNLEKLLVYILEKEIRILGLDIVQGNTLERNSRGLSPTLDRVKRNLVIDYGKHGMHLPDVDIVIFDPLDSQVIAVLSIKVTLRERIAQTGYWKLKLSAAPVTRNIKVFFVTPDEDGTLIVKSPAKKGRAIVEVDTDGGYVMSENGIEESERVKTFDKLISDLMMLLSQKRKAR